MKVYDPIYGQFEVPKCIRGLVLSPEFRRLSQIRLLNCITPTLATLGEIRRYSHTLGVVRLAMEWLQSPNSSNWRAFKGEFLAAVLLHDIATPPFGHIFEYQLKERFHWDHENVIVDVLRGTYAADNTAHQIFAHRSLSLLKEIHDEGLDPNLIVDILEKKHPLATLLFGTLDFDNLDNVSRMSWALGYSDNSVALKLASSLSLSKEGSLELHRNCATEVERWFMMRRQCYETLVFDPETSAAQAIMTEALRFALDNEVIGLEDWDLTDEGLLARLSEHKPLRGRVSSQYLGRLPTCYCIAQWVGAIGSIRDQSEIIHDKAKKIATDAGVESPLIYMFWDSGTFEKKVDFLGNGQPWSMGSHSQSLIIYVFSNTRTLPSGAARRRLLPRLHGCIPATSEGSWKIKFPINNNDKQTKLDI